MPNRFARLLVSLFCLMAPLAAQTFRLGDPHALSGGGTGWSVAPGNGALQFSFPLTTLRGDMSVPLVFRMNGSHEVVTKVIDQGGTLASRQVDRPVYGTLHFGYISDDATFNDVLERGVTVLESGRQVVNVEWTDARFGNAPIPALNLPARFGFTNITDLTARVVQLDPSGTLARYEAPSVDFGSNQARVLANLPQGYTVDTSHYMVVMDPEKARVFVKINDAPKGLQVWVPVLWVDRGGRVMNFKWVYETGASLPNTCTVSPGDASQGVKVAWIDGAVGNSDVAQTLLETSLVGSPALRAPTLRVTGFPGVAAGRPTGLTEVTGTYNPIVPAVSGLRGRPTEVQMTGEGETRTWNFSYDAAKAEIDTITDAAGVGTTFLRESYAFRKTASDTHAIWIRGVWSANSTHPSSGSIQRIWQRNMPQTDGTTWTNSDWSCTYVEQYSGEPGGGRRIRYTFAGVYSPHYGNGAVETEEILNDASVRVGQTVYGLVPAGITPGAEGSAPNYLRIERNGEPTREIFSTRTTDGLFVSHQVVKVDGAEVEVVDNTWEGDATQLETYRLKTTTRTLTSQGVVLGTLVSGTDYQSDGLPQQSYEAAGGQKAGQSFSWENGRVKTISTFAEGLSAAGSTTRTLGYHPMGQVASVSVSGNNIGMTVQTTGVNPEGLLSSETDAAGNTTGYAYDVWGRPTHVSKTGEPGVDITYYGLFNRSLTKGGQSRSESYDPYGRLISVSLSGGRGQSFAYDQSSRQVSVREISAGGVVRSTNTAYDDLDRVSSSVSASGVDQNFEYGSFGQLRRITTRTRTSVVSDAFVDAFGRVVKQIAPDGVVTESTYNARGQVLEVRVTAGAAPPQTRSFAYDPLGRLVSRSEPETGTTSFRDHLITGAPQTIEEAGGRLRSLGYDGLGRLVSSSGTDGSAAGLVTYHYDGVFLDWAQSGDYTTYYSYGGPGGRLSQERQQKGGVDLFTIGYGYDGEARLQTLTYPSGRVVSYGYDGQGRAISLQQKAPGAQTFASVVNSVDYDDWGSLTKLTFASLAQSEWKGDYLGNHLDKWTVGYAGGTPEQRTYQYDTLDHLLKAGDWNVTHDSQGRLLTADNPSLGVTTTHGHDGFGNNISHGVTPGSMSPQPLNAFSFNPMGDNRVPVTTLSGGDTGWNTNLRGEATTIGAYTSSNQAIDLTWDGLGRLIQANGPIAHQAYAYGPHGMRVAVTDSLQRLNNRAYAYTTGGMLLGEYVPGNGPAHTGQKAARVFHKTGTHSALSRGLGAFAAGDTVTVSVWFKAAAGRSGQIFLDDRRAYGAGETKASVSAPGDGTWKQLVLTKVVTQADSLWLHLYGDMYTPTSGAATDADAVIYDDLVVSSPGRGTVLGETFEAGLVVGVDPDSTTEWTTSGEVVDVVEATYEPTAWGRDVLYLGGQAVAEIDATGTHELHADHLGSPLIVTAGPGAYAGHIEGRQVFGPYGELISAAGYRPLTGYTGHTAVDPTGLIYMRARYYSPAWHRFLNSDQGVDPNSWNQFAYVGGSPYMATDPSGLAGKKVKDLIGDCENNLQKVKYTDGTYGTEPCGFVEVVGSETAVSKVTGNYTNSAGWPVNTGMPPMPSSNHRVNTSLLSPQQKPDCSKAYAKLVAAIAGAPSIGPALKQSGTLKTFGKDFWDGFAHSAPSGANNLAWFGRLLLMGAEIPGDWLMTSSVAAGEVIAGVGNVLQNPSDPVGDALQAHRDAVEKAMAEYKAALKDCN